MSYNAVPTVATGDAWSAANHNTYIRDNFAAGVPDIFTAAGDIAYATAANAAAALAIGSAGQVLISSSDGLPEWGDAFKITARQGGSATDYSVAGTTNYTPGTELKVQIGVAEFTSTPQTVTITFPVAFSAPPMVIVPFGGWLVSGNSGGYPNAEVTNRPQTKYFYMSVNFTSLSGVYHIPWIAIGPIA